MSMTIAPTGNFPLRWAPRQVTGWSQGAVKYRADALSAIEAAVLPRPRERRIDFTSEVVELIDSEAVDLLAELSDSFGLPWSSVAAAVGVSVPALRKWRQGLPITEPNRRTLATLVAVCREIGFLNLGQPSDWLDRWVWPEVPVRRLQLLALGHADVLRALAHGAMSPVQALDEAVPQWRDRYTVGEDRVEFDERGRPTIYVS